MGRYNRKLDFSPFERFQLGGDGLNQNGGGIIGYDVVSLRGYPVFQESNPAINPDLSNATKYFTIFNKYSLELRYPLVTNPSSTIYALTFFDAANGWYSFKNYNPFRLRRSTGVGMRFFLPMFGLLGFDYGIGLGKVRKLHAMRFALLKESSCLPKKDFTLVWYHGVRQSFFYLTPLFLLTTALPVYKNPAFRPAIE
jgi:outer membrane protein assembly factor BamA